MEKVSIIVPVYNAEKYISRCVQSILEQDYPNIELILVDDGSKDGSARILDDFASADSRVKVIHKPNGGVSSTRNRGLAEATGRYIQFADSDDYLAKESTKLLVRSLETYSSDMVIGDFYRVAGDAQSHKGSISKSGLITRREYADLMMKDPANLYYGVLWNKLYRRSIIEEHHIKMDENISMSEDLIFNLEYLLHVSNVSVLTVPVYYYEMTPGSLVAQNLNLPKLVEMKENVISYYNDFYKEILSPTEYIERIPNIYGYLLAFSTDSLALNFFNHKKDQENPVPSPNKHSLLVGHYFSELLISKYMNTLVQKYSIDFMECRILYCIHISEKAMNISQLAEILEASSAHIAISIGKLLRQKYIKREHIHKIDAFADSYNLSDANLAKDLDFLEQDFRNVIFKGISQERIDRYLNIQQEICANILQNL